jgi:hypothetical protein
MGGVQERVKRRPDGRFTDMLGPVAHHAPLLSVRSLRRRRIIQERGTQETCRNGLLPSQARLCRELVTPVGSTSPLPPATGAISAAGPGAVALPSRADHPAETVVLLEEKLPGASPNNSPKRQRYATSLGDW